MYTLTLPYPTPHMYTLTRPSPHTHTHARSRGDHNRNVCIIPVSAHGTNPASAVMAGMRIVTVSSDSAGNINRAELRAKAEEHKASLAALMITYPSTYGVYEEDVDVICKVIHENGGQVREGGRGGGGRGRRIGREGSR